MAEQHRDKDQQNYLLDQARTIRDGIEVPVFGPAGHTPPCAEAWPTAKLIAELIHRIEALEAAQPPQPNHSEIPDGSLKERIKSRINQSFGCTWDVTTASVLTEIAAWLRKHYGGPTATTDLLEREAER